MKRLCLAFLLLCAAAPVVAGRAASAPAPSPAAANAQQYPAWEQLSQAERDLLIAPLRERWNAQPASRARMMNHARDWKTMTPEQRRRAHHGHERWRHMKPEQRQHVRALYSKMRTMTPEQRRELRAQWRAMTPEQRQAWIDRNPPAPAPARVPAEHP